MGSVPAELSLDLRPAELSFDLKPTFVPKTISDFFCDVSKITNASERFLRVNDFLRRLQEEMGKIDAFKRELPLCMNLLNDAISAVSEESTKCRPANSQPVLEEFIPLKKECDLNEEIKEEKECKDKKNWMSSVQLWNTSNYTCTNNANGQTQHFNVENKKFEEEEEKSVAKNSIQSCTNRNEGREFMLLTAHSAVPVIAVTTKKEKEEPAIDGLSLLTPRMPNLREGSASTGSRSSSNGGVSSCPPSVQPNSRIATQHQSGRKQRRCWSPELHRRFVNALQQLGGSQAATPKQIRELMQVDGLTNDEVKSHLQKYRLHTRRIPPSSAATANQPVVVLGGLWMSQDQYNESSKATSSGSPQGPLQLTASGRGSSPNSMEDDEDEKSESHSWKKHIHRHGTDDV